MAIEVGASRRVTTTVEGMSVSDALTWLLIVYCSSERTLGRMRERDELSRSSSWGMKFDAFNFDDGHEISQPQGSIS